MSTVLGRLSITNATFAVLFLICLVLAFTGHQPVSSRAEKCQQAPPVSAAAADCQLPENLRFYSQSAEDRALFKRYFKEPLFCHGTFVELGASNGVVFSNTKFLEDSLGWNGVLIEAQPNHTQKLMMNRPRARIFPLAVCPEGQETVQFVGQAAFGGIASEMPAAQRHAKITSDMKEVTLPCKPMSYILRHAGITHIDLFSLDVEGAELLVLQTMDWSIPVRVFVIEMRRGGRNSAKDLKIIDLLQQHGYYEADWNIRDYCPPKQYCTSNVVFENGRIYNVKKINAIL